MSWTVTFLAGPWNGDLPMLGVASNELTGPSALLQIYEVESGSLALSGNFTISFREFTSDPVDYAASASALRSAIIALPNIGSVSVQRDSRVDGFDWTVSFQDNGGALEPLGVSAAMIHGESTHVDVTRTSSGTPLYAPRSAVQVTVLDDEDTAGLKLSQTALEVIEANKTAEYSVVLEVRRHRRHGTMFALRSQLTPTHSSFILAPLRAVKSRPFTWSVFSRLCGHRLNAIR